MSDHISGPRALADPIADITDVYAFPGPERQGHLVVVQNSRDISTLIAQVTEPARVGGVTGLVGAAGERTHAAQQAHNRDQRA